ncbi:hypothetical protein COV19_07330 [Candidatus Woesearchaeota archaeon CG10_big_fil_rev_8_21_14_0_10_44_13]|nr:MAG: hypothetical protein COV19_07330 [Candidatus Woesearchaeota archaeon CG10_big_fil_rev_8_21_14_0_10_44_13]
MKLDYLLYAFENVKHKKMRSMLTVLSILIGIMAIFALVSFGQGLSSYINDLSTQMGTDKIMIYAKGVGAPGTDDTFKILKSEIDFVGKVRGISEITGMYASVVEVEFNKQKKYAYSVGLSQGKEKAMIEEMINIKVDEGRDLKEGDKMKVVLGDNYRIPEKIFKKPVKVGDIIKVNGVDVQVVGFYEPIGNPQDDAQVYFTIEGMETLLPAKKDRYDYAIARVNPDMNPQEVAKRAAEKLRKYKGQKEGQEDFYIQTFEQMIETFTTIFNVLNGVLVLIALISLIVAAVNIANTMYTAVLERTREIGIMKAVGAKNFDIAMMFLFEAGLLGAVGGALGIFMGYLIARLGGFIAANAGYSLLYPIFPAWLIIGCLLFSFFVGALSGLFPAIQASKLKPVDALRYE